MNPWVQGLLDLKVSSVGSAGKRFTGPFSESASPHLPQAKEEHVVPWVQGLLFLYIFMLENDIIYDNGIMRYMKVFIGEEEYMISDKVKNIVFDVGMVLIDFCF